MATVTLDGVVTSTSSIRARRSVAWSSSLPQSPLFSGYVDSEAENFIRSQITTSIAFQRSRSGANPKSITFPLLLSHAERLLLDSFYDTDLRGGTRTFVLKLPGDNSISRLRFASPPAYRAVSHDLWSMQLQLEVVTMDDVIGQVV